MMIVKVFNSNYIAFIFFIELVEVESSKKLCVRGVYPATQEQRDSFACVMEKVELMKFKINPESEFGNAARAARQVIKKVSSAHQVKAPACITE
jgi:hypothetical protein